MMITPRGYQQFAIDSIFRYFEENKEGNPVVAMPTGTGKSIINGGFIQQVFARWGGQRIMMLTHVKELIAQNADKISQMWPGAPVGIFSAGLKSKNADMPITFAGIQSAIKRPALFGHIDLVFVDECHLVSQNANTSYHKFIEALKETNPHLRVVGLTATPYRLGLGLITDGGIFTDVCCDMTTVEAFNWFIDQGYMSPLIPRPTDTKINLTGVRMRGGEFKEDDLQKAVDVDSITEAAVSEMLEVGHDRNRFLIFATGIDHVEHITDLLISKGHDAVAIHSKVTDRDEKLEQFSRGVYRFAVNNNILTTGFDDPLIDCIAMLRPTASPGLWVQMLGRGTRPVYAGGYDHSWNKEQRLAAIAEGPKQNCLVLDYAGNTMRLGPINDPQIPNKKGKGTGEVPIKLCRDDNTVDGAFGCGAYNHISSRWCCDCSSEFTFEVKIKQTAAVHQLVKKSEVPKVTEFTVDKVVYALHRKTGKPNSIKVTYHCGMRAFTEYVLAWHLTGVRHKGMKWWEERTEIPLPKSAADAMQFMDDVETPTSIRVWINKRYPEVMSHVF